MKYVITFLLIFVTYDSLACSKRVSVLELSKIQSKQAAVAGCREGTKCFCYEGIDLRDAKVGMKSVDDETKPIYEDVIETYEEFVGYEQKQVDDETKPILDADGNITGYEQRLVDDETKPVYEQVSKVVGQEVVGYEQKEVEGLIIDEAKKAARLAKEEELRLKRKAIQERMDKKQDAQEALLESLITDDLGNDLTPQEIQENIGALKRAVQASKAQGPK